ncbi:MAG: keto-deoxy-phosphogluconate aldolase [Hyphomicrobiales bacterium]|nr:MAG: keto-deoxy-phosphogluconate aldolase [Hyphomicrobiales bacterium]
MTQNIDLLLPILTRAPVVPVLIVEDVATAVPLAKALVAGGLTALEVTLRTPAALDVIKAIAENVEGADIGAGTILTPAQLEAAVEAGAKFLVSPGAAPDLLKAAEGSPAPLLPGTATASEAMQIMERGYTYMKFFPAEQAGGAPYLKALSSPLADLRFCPTGGVSLANVKDYLSLPNVVCVGGSWVAPKQAIAEGNWTLIESLAAEAAAIRP